MSEPAETVAAPAATKPVKPDEALYKEQLDKADKDHAAVMADFNAIKAKIELAQPNKNKDSPTPAQQRRAELIAKVNEIRQQQAGSKNTRTGKQEQIKRLDEQLRSRQAEQKNARGKVAFKSAEDVDNEIARLEGEVNSGVKANGGIMKLVDEKKALAEISNLRKLRKNFVQFDNQQTEIDELKAKIKAIKDTLQDPAQKALGEEYDRIQAELDSIKAESDEAYKGLSKLRDEKSRLQALQREKFEAVRKIKDEYYAQKKAFADYEWEAKKKARERRKAEEAKRIQDAKKERAQRMLTDAGDPAYLDEIRRANSLLHFFDPSYQAAERAPLLASSGLEAQASREVDDSALQGTRLVRKEDREDEYFVAAPKGKKGKKNKKHAADAKTFSCPPSVMEDCAFVGIDPPMSAADVPAAIEKVKNKLDHWKADQAAQTQRNVDKAKKEIEKIEAEEAAQEGPASNGVNGAGGDDGVAKVASDLKNVSVDEKTDENKDDEDEKEEVAAA